MKKTLIVLTGMLLLFSLCLALPASALTITSPNGGESWLPGTTHTITWSYNNFEPKSNVQINLYKQITVRLPSGLYATKDVLEYTINTVSNTQNSYFWYIPTTNQDPSTKYHVEVKLVSSPSTYDRSDTYFTIRGVRVTSPNGGENWARGISHRITWYQAGLTGSNVKVDLLFYPTITPSSIEPKVSPIAASVPAEKGYVDWTPPMAPTGIIYTGTYAVRVTSLSTYWLVDESDKTFRLSTLLPSPSTIKVTSPTCGEAWLPGTTHTVTWTSTGNVGPNVKIQLLNNNVVVGTAIDSTPNDGSFDWTISSTRAPGTNYQIQVTSTTTGVKGTSCVFTIGQPNPTQASIVVTSPKAGDSWQRGTTHQVTWTSTGAVGPNVKIELWQGSTLAGTAAPSTENDGSHLWTISSTRAPGTYWIKVTSLSQPSISGTSGDFTITS